jgi:hypothetical protein
MADFAEGLVGVGLGRLVQTNLRAAEAVDGADLVEAQVQMSAGILISRVDTAGGRCLIAFLMERRCRLHDRWHLRHHGALQIS